MVVSDLTQKYALSQRFLRMPNGKKVFSSAKQAYNFLFMLFILGYKKLSTRIFEN